MVLHTSGIGPLAANDYRACGNSEGKGTGGRGAEDAEKTGVRRLKPRL